MHRTIRVRDALLGGLLVFGLAVSTAPARAADPTPVFKGVFKVAVGVTKPLETSNKQKIDSFANEKDTVADVKGGDTLSTVVITGKAPGVSKLVLKTPDQTETWDIIVEQDLDLLNNLIKRTVPTASITIVPGGGATLILTGTVAHSEDIDTILSIARSFALSLGGGGGGPPQVINAIRVGGVMQVQLDVVVARVGRSQLRQLGFSFLQSGDQHVFASSIGGSVSVPTGGVTVTPGQLPVVGNTLSPTNLFLGVFNTNQQIFNLLNALRSNNLTKLLAEPKLVTMSGKPAQFLDGGDQAVPVVSGFGGTAGIQFEPFGTRVQFLPIVLGNGKIYMEITPEITRLDAAAGTTLPGGGAVPGRATQRVQTSVMLEDGQTFIIGGLIENTISASISKYPVLGDLPFIGPFFSSKSYNEEEDETMFMVTPHLVDPLDCAQAPKYVVGQETRTPDDFELFLEQILEAPRGLREVCHDRTYVPAWENSPTAKQFPCGGGYNGVPDSARGNLTGSHHDAGVPISGIAPNHNPGMMSASVPPTAVETFVPTGAAPATPPVPNMLPTLAAPTADGTR
jgi:pilus assembly protein CpaC